MKKNNFINKWLDENQDPKIEAKVKAEAEELIKFTAFEKAWSLRKLRSDINPKCACKGGFCYKWEGNEIVKACKTKERLNRNSGLEINTKER